MVKVRNDSRTTHEIPQYGSELMPNGKRRKIKLYKRHYKWTPGQEIDVPKEDYDAFIDPDDHQLAKVYTKKQWKEREELINRQKAPYDQYLELADLPNEQEKVRKKMILTDEQRYLMHNVLPHEV